MKKIQYITSLFCLFLFCACATMYKTPYYSFDEDLEFKVQQVYSMKNTTKGSGNNQISYFAGKNKVFRQVVFKVKNNSSQDKIIDFKKFKLIDSKNDEYEPGQVGQAMKLAFGTEKYQFKLKAGKTKTYIVEFWPPYPKDEAVKKLMIYGENYEISPQK